jgi:hypothetical protein
MVAAQLPPAAHAVSPAANMEHESHATSNWVDLGWLLKDAVVPRLTVVEAARLATTCKGMRTQVFAWLAQLRQLSLPLLGAEVVANEPEALAWVATRCPALELLSLDAHCTDDHLAALVSGTGQLRCLREVSLVGSPAATDQGLAVLLAHGGRSPASRLPSLRLVDATSCGGVTHASVAVAKQAGVQLARIPAWFGAFISIAPTGNSSPMP